MVKCTDSAQTYLDKFHNEGIGVFTYMQKWPVIGTLRERQKWARTRKGWSQEMLADKSGVPRTTIARIEGKTDPILWPRNIQELADTLEVPITWLLFGIEDIDPKDIELLMALRSLSDEQKAAISEAIKALSHVKLLPSASLGLPAPNS